jgi:septum formation protein
LSDIPLLVLASSSPYREALLQRLRIPYTTAAPQVDESRRPNESPQALVARLAEDKARAVAVTTRTAALFIGSDQVAVNGGQVLGKPAGHAEAMQQLRDASGRRVIFYTALCLLNSGTGHVQRAVVPFAVVFRDLTDIQIEHYLRREQPYNCAGSFKSEGLGVALFDRLEGEDPSALVGLPLIRLIRMLENEGVTII